MQCISFKEGERNEVRLSPRVMYSDDDSSKSDNEIGPADNTVFDGDIEPALGMRGNDPIQKEEKTGEQGDEINADASVNLAG